LLSLAKPSFSLPIGVVSSSGDSWQGSDEESVVGLVEGRVGQFPGGGYGGPSYEDVCALPRIGWSWISCPILGGLDVRP